MFGFSTQKHEAKTTLQAKQNRYFDVSSQPSVPAIHGGKDIWLGRSGIR